MLMKSAYQFSFLILCVFALASCNRVGPVTGSVFIVTRGGESVKMSLVQVHVIPAQSVLDYLTEKWPRIRAAEIEKTEPLDRVMDATIVDLPTGIKRADTDADGRFTVELPANKDFFLTAESSRIVEGEAEKYFWLVYLPASRKESEPVLLSNNNLLTEDRFGALALEAAAKTFRSYEPTHFP